MSSRYIISVQANDAAPVNIRPGGQAERDLIDNVRVKLQQLGVGWFKSEAKVLTAVETALLETFHQLKSDILP